MTSGQRARVAAAGDAGAGRHRRQAERRTPYGEVFAVREFRWLWAAQALSFIGDQFAQVALAILVFHRTGSAFLTALVYSLSYLPPIAGGPLLAGLADLFPRRTVMIICDVIRVGTVGLMAVRGVPFVGLCVLLFCTVLLGAPFTSARSALLPDVLTSEQLPIGSAIGNITHQSSQILGFVAGAAVVATLDPYRTLAVDAGSFIVSALMVTFAVRRRPAPERSPGQRPSLWSVSATGIKLVFGSPVLRTLLLFGWLAGFYVVPEGLAAPYAHSLGGTTLSVGLLMAAVPVGTVVGALLFGRLVTPSGQVRVMGWLAMLSCAPLIACAWNPPLWAVLAFWGLAGIGGAFQLAAVPAFVLELRPEMRARAFGVAQSGLYAVQGLGIVAGGLLAQAAGPPVAVALAGLLGLCCAAWLAMNWVQLRGKVIAEQHRRAEPALCLGRAWRRLALLLLVHERLGDRVVLALLGHDRPGDHVRQHAEAVEEREDPEAKPNQVDVPLEVVGDPRAHPSDHPALAAAQ